MAIFPPGLTLMFYPIHTQFCCLISVRRVALGLRCVSGVGANWWSVEGGVILPWNVIRSRVIQVRSLALVVSGPIYPSSNPFGITDHVGFANVELKHRMPSLQSIDSSCKPQEFHLVPSSHAAVIRGGYSTPKFCLSGWSLLYIKCKVKLA